LPENVNSEAQSSNITSKDNASITEVDYLSKFSVPQISEDASFANSENTDFKHREMGIVMIQRKADGAVNSGPYTSPFHSRFKEEFLSSTPHKSGHFSLFSTLGLQFPRRVRNKQHALSQSKTVHLSQFSLSSDETCSGASSGGLSSISGSKLPIPRSMIDGNNYRSQDDSAVES
jgi:hypothetical protein